MKKNLLLGLSFVLAAMVMVSCSKDQKAVNKLEGTWNATSAVVNGADWVAAGLTYKVTFADCKKGATDCDMTVVMTLAGDSQTENAHYSVAGDGTLLLTDSQDDDEVDYDTLNITSLSKDALVLTSDDSNDPFTITLAKE